MNRIPRQLKKEKGTYRSNEDPNKDVKFEIVESIKVPTFLKGESKKSFLLLVDELGLNGYKLLTKLDIPALVLLSDAYGEYIETCKVINKEGRTMTQKNSRGKDNTVQHPLLSYKRQLFKDIILLLKEFGLTPASKNRVEFNPLNGAEAHDTDFDF